ncbi:MAG TPA: O-antigen ligase family protein [Chloroflexota bacterium]|nr:O-antigen ligase family protein [Chloroflexota bacterium]
MVSRQLLLPVRLRPTWQPALMCLGAVGLLITADFPPLQAAGLILILAAVAAVLIEPKVGYFALTAAVPFGSVLSLPVGASQVTVSDVLVGALFAGWLLLLARRRNAPVLTNAWVYAVVALIAVMMLSTTQSTSLSLSLKEIVKWLELVAVVVIAPTVLLTRSDVRTVLLVTVWAAALEACVGLVQFAFGLGPASFRFHGAFLRAYGTFQQPNPMAGYLNFVLPFALAAAWMTKSRSMMVATSLIAAGSLVTFSRAGWAAGVLGVAAVCLILAPRLRVWPLFIGLAAAVSGLMLSFSLLPSALFLKAADSLGITGIDFRHYSKSNFSEIERAAHWVAGLRMFPAHPLLGVGIGNYSAAYPAYHVGNFVHPLGHAHNYFINIAAEAGVLGLVAYLLFTATGLWYALTIAREHSRPALVRILAVGMVGAWVSLSFHNLFDVLFVHAMPTLLGVLMGVLMTAVALDDRQHRRPSLPRGGGAGPRSGITPNGAAESGLLSADV